MPMFQRASLHARNALSGLGWPLFVLSVFLAACDGGASTTGEGGGGSGAAGGEGGATPTTATGDGGSSTASTGDSTTGGGGGGSTDVPPVEQNALFQWLKDGNYQAYAPESGPHVSAGPHGGKVRTFVNPILLASLQAGNVTHPKGAAAVKELYGNGSSVSGYAVSVKTEDDSAAGQGWYWYETYNLNDPASVVAAANGVPLCVNCHSGGTDHVLTPFPLQ